MRVKEQQAEQEKYAYLRMCGEPGQQRYHESGETSPFFLQRLVHSSFLSHNKHA